MKVHSRVIPNEKNLEGKRVNTPKLIFVALIAATGIGLGSGLGLGHTAAAQSDPPQSQATPQAADASAPAVAAPTAVPAASPKKAKSKPAPTSVPEAVPAINVPAGSLRVKIIACVDVNRDRVCFPDEARIPGVKIMVGDQVAVTGNTGETDVIVPANSQIEVVAPEGYKDANGNARVQLIAAERLDIPLVVGAALPAPLTAAGPVAAPVIGPGIEVKLPDNFTQQMQPIINFDVDLRPIYIGLASIGGIILLGYLLLGGSLRGIKHVYQVSLAKQDAALSDQHTRELAVRLQMQQGWQQIAEQLIADAVSEIISVDGDAGVLDATATPTPKFTVVSRDGREFIFTVNPKILKKMRLVKPGDKIINITNVSATSRMDVQALWDYIVRSRNMWSATPPSKAEWYVVVRQSNRGVSQYKLGGRTAAQIGRP